jgi:hypothetical protein
MKLEELKASTTDLEFQMLTEIVEHYDFENNLCYTKALTPSEKGVVGSLVKKGYIYDSFSNETGEGYTSNFFPSNEVLDIYGLEHY